MILAAIYTIVFFLVIHYSPFFRADFFGIKKVRPVSLVFLIKVFCGFALTWIYTRYYTDRQTADIFKYYDDAKVMFSAFENHNYSDYMKMLCGVSNDTPYFDEQYYTKMNHWYRLYDYGTYNDNHTIIRFNALVMLFCRGSFHGHTVFMCFVSLWGLTALHRTLKDYLPLKQNALFVAIFLLPSVLFWGSCVLKEGILLFALGFLFYSFFNVFIHARRILVNLLLLVVSVFLLLINKQYLLVAAAPALTCFFIVEKLSFPKPFLFYLGIYLLAFGVAYLISSDQSGNNLLKMLSQKQRDFIALSKGGVFLQNGREFARVAPDKKVFLDTLSKNTFKIRPGSSYMYWKNEDLTDTIFVTSSTDTSTYALVWDLPLAGSTIEVPVLEPTFGSLFKTAPRAMYNALAKPGFLSSKSLLEKVSALENALILIFLIVCTALCRTGMNKNLFSLCFFVAVSILFLIGYTTPIAGAIVRYKVPVLPFIVLCGIIIFDTNRLKIFSDKPKP